MADDVRNRSKKRRRFVWGVALLGLGLWILASHIIQLETLEYIGQGWRIALIAVGLYLILWRRGLRES